MDNNHNNVVPASASSHTDNGVAASASLHTDNVVPATASSQSDVPFTSSPIFNSGSPPGSPSWLYPGSMSGLSLCVAQPSSSGLHTARRPRAEQRSHSRRKAAFLPSRQQSEELDSRQYENPGLLQGSLMGRWGRHTAVVRNSLQMLRPSRESTATKASSVPSKKPRRLRKGAREPAQKGSTAHCVRPLYYWSATAGVLLLVQTVLDCLSHQFKYVPPWSELCGSLLLLYPLAAVAAVRFIPSARPCAPYLMALGSILLTCHLAWYWDHHMSEFKRDVVSPQHGARAVLCDAGSHPTRRPLYYSWYGAVFGCTPLDLLDAATLLVTALHNCLQSWPLSRLGVRAAAVASAIQWAILACWPLVSPGLYPAWALRIVVPGVWTAHLIYCSRLFDSVLKRQQATARELENRDQADGMLIHMLKNTMADALGCIDRVASSPGADRAGPLCKASNILFRGMSWCKLHIAMISIVAGRYESVCTTVDVQKFTEDLLRGREVECECPAEAVELDPTACHIVLDNAVTNAFRHGCPDDPQVKLAVHLTDPDPTTPVWDRDAVISPAGPSQARAKTLRFLLTNRANPQRAPLTDRWSSRGAGDCLPHDAARPALSDGLGLQHIRIVAGACGMVAQLWQDGPDVLFELCVPTTTAAATAGLSPLQPAQLVQPFPHGLTILCLDDSGVARESLQCILEAEVPGATVATFGRNAAEVENFKATALGSGDIIIVDQHLNIPGEERLGTDIIAELIEEGYAGFAGIRSGDAAEADEALSRAAGAHWHVGKEVRLRDMVHQLQVQYNRFLQSSAAERSRRDSSAGSFYPPAEASDAHKCWAIPGMQPDLLEQ